MLKYFFGYYFYHGKVEAIAWPEDDGRNIGTKVHYIQREEITERQFETSTLTELTSLYPFIEPPESSPV